MKKPLHIDLETRSRVNLPKRGAYNYADDCSILIASYAIGNGPIKRWEGWRGKAMPAQLVNMLADRKLELVAHNAAFERLVLSKHKLVRREDTARWLCTATQARAAALPGGLEDLGRFITSTMRKDPTGAALMRALSIPDAEGKFSNSPTLLKQYGDYCDADVAAMRNISGMIPQMTDEARELYAVSEAINDRGLLIDTELCDLALKYADREAVEAIANVRTISGGELKTARGTKLTAWVYDRLPEEAQKVMRVHKGGKERLTLDADTRANLQAMAEEQPELFDQDVIDIIDAADAAAASSVAKFRRMKDMASADGRLRGAFVMNGASGTGRFSSKGAQAHNFPRVCAKDPEAVKALMKKGADLGGPVLTVLKSMLRAAICAGDGRMIVRSDWNAVEARGLPWLTNSAAGDRYLDAFRDTSRDVYTEQAIAAGLGPQRQPGKVVVLALGYGGAEGALTVMSKGYGVAIDDKTSVVKNWRRSNRWAVTWWYDLTAKAITALRRRGQWHTAGRVAFRGSVDGELPALQLKLPSGRTLYYPYAELHDDEITYRKAAWKPKADAKEWPRAKLWHGLLAENATQAACADLLRYALVQGVKADLPIIGHVHDEGIAETTRARATVCAEALSGVMLSRPTWADGFPLAVETDINPRFRK